MPAEMLHALTSVGGVRLLELSKASL